LLAEANVEFADYEQLAHWVSFRLESPRGAA